MTTDRQTKSGDRGGNIVTNDTILKVSKEVAIKFIEMGRVTPATFDETFKSIHTTIKETVNGR